MSSNDNPVFDSKELDANLKLSIANAEITRLTLRLTKLEATNKELLSQEDSLITENSKIALENTLLRKSNKQLLSALESVTALFPEIPVKDGSGGVGWCNHVGEAYDQAQKAITNAKQVMGDKGYE